MSNPKVLLLELKERTSASGNRYMSGWLGKASVVAFLDKDAAEPTWQVYVSTPQPKADQAQTSGPRHASIDRTSQNPEAWRRDIPPQSAQRSNGRRRVQAGTLNDDVSDIGGGGR